MSPSNVANGADVVRRQAEPPVDGHARGPTRAPHRSPSPANPPPRKTLHDHVVSGKDNTAGNRHAGDFCGSGRGALPARCAGGGPSRPVPGGRPRRHPPRRHPRQEGPIRYRARSDGGRSDRLVLQEAGGALVAEATCTMARRAERAARKLPMRDRLYQQFIAAAGRALGTLRQYTDGGRYFPAGAGAQSHSWTAVACRRTAATWCRSSPTPPRTYRRPDSPRADRRCICPPRSISVHDSSRRLTSRVNPAIMRPRTPE